MEIRALSLGSWAWVGSCVLGPAHSGACMDIMRPSRHGRNLCANGMVRTAAQRKRRDRSMVNGDGCVRELI